MKVSFRYYSLDEGDSVYKTFTSVVKVTYGMDRTYSMSQVILSFNRAGEKWTEKYYPMGDVEVEE